MQKKSTFRILLATLGLALTLNLSAQQRRHVVQSGETIFAIARKYNLNPHDIIRLNPSTGNGDNIRAGQTLILPAKEQAQAVSQPAQPLQPTQQPRQQPQYSPVQQQQTRDGVLGSGCKEMYRIQKKDNLYRIALQFGVPIEEICAANPGITPDSKLKKNEWLCIPYSHAELRAEAERQAALKAQQEAERAQQEAAVQKAQKATHRNHLNVGVILPLKSGGDKGQKMMEFYRGLLMAADSVKQQGCSVDIYTYHSGTTEAEMQSILAHPEMRQMDMIFGPLEPAQAASLNRFSKQHGIRLITPFSTTNSYSQDNPYAYLASISSEAARQVASDKILGLFPRHNFIILNTNSADGRGSQFTSELRAGLSARGKHMQNLNINADEDAFLTTLSRTQTNLIVPDASSLSVTNQMVQRLQAFKREHPECKIAILGYPEWPTYVSKLRNAFHDLDTYAYTTFYRDPNAARIHQFEKNYATNFNQEMARTFPRYGLFGFDLAYFFMNGVSRLGDYFDEKQQSLNYRTLQNSFSFEQANGDSPHVNLQIILIHYTPEQKVEIIK